VNSVGLRRPCVIRPAGVRPEHGLPEIDRLAADASVPGPEKILRLLRIICTASRDKERRTGLLAQALVEFPRTGKEDETHKKKDLVHEKVCNLQRDLLKSLESLCANVGVADPNLLAQQLLLLANGYLIMEPLLGKSQAVKLTLQTAQALMGITAAVETPMQKSSRPGGRRVHTPNKISEEDGPKVISPPKKYRPVILPKT
jgi:hypothetical protein